MSTNFIQYYHISRWLIHPPQHTCQDYRGMKIMHTLLSSLAASMQGNGSHDMIPVLVFLHLPHQIHIKNELPCQFQTSCVRLRIWKPFGNGLFFPFFLKMDQQGNDPTVLSLFHSYASFGEVKHRLLVFWEQISVRENYICTGAST